MSKLSISLLCFFSVTIFHCHAMKTVQRIQTQQQIESDIDTLRDITKKEYESWQDKIKAYFKDEKSRINVLNVKLTSKYLASKNTLLDIDTAYLISVTIRLLDGMYGNINSDLKNNFNNIAKKLTQKACDSIQVKKHKQEFYNIIHFLSALLINNNNELTKNYFKNVQFKYESDAIDIITRLKKRTDPGNHPVMYAKLVKINPSFDPDYNRQKTEISNPGNNPVAAGIDKSTLENQQLNNQKGPEAPSSWSSLSTMMGLSVVLSGAFIAIAQFYFPQVLPTWLPSWLLSE